jgi:DNA mismatch repair protein MutH
MFQHKYDKSSVDSIVSYADLLTGKSLNEVVTLPGQVENLKNKGDLGRLVEAHFFEINPSNKEIDFPEAGLELKVTGLNQKSTGIFVAKERLVLGMINFQQIVNEEWETSYLVMKCQLMLILFYHFNKEIPRADQKFVLPPLLYEISSWDEIDLRRDWETIRSKVAAGRAHELSEGDTFLLGACRKGAGGEGEALVSQPASGTKAKSRAYAFKPSYLNRVIQRHQGLLVEPTLMPVVSFEEATLSKFEPYLGASVSEISAQLNYFKSGPNHKGFLGELSRRMFGTAKKALPEFAENGIEMKTVRLGKGGVPPEDMSFPHFDFLTLHNQEWEDSEFFDKIERKFLFVVFALDSEGELRFQKVFYWNMPFEDRLEAAAVWHKTKELIGQGSVSFPRASQSRVAHVRPHGRNRADTLSLPDGTQFTKQAFWLNRRYVSEIVRGVS